MRRVGSPPSIAATIDGAMALLAPDVEWINLPKGPRGQRHHPLAGHLSRRCGSARLFFARATPLPRSSSSSPASWSFKATRAFGTIHDVSRIKSTGAEFDIEFATWMQIQDGRIANWKS